MRKKSKNIKDEKVVIPEANLPIISILRGYHISKINKIKGFI